MPRLNDTKAIAATPIGHAPPSQVWCERDVSTKTGKVRDPGLGVWACGPGMGANPDAGKEGLRGAIDELRKPPQA